MPDEVAGCPEREVRYCTTEDGVRIAYSVTGSEEPFVLVTDILTSHVEREWDFHKGDSCDPSAELTPRRLGGAQALHELLAGAEELPARTNHDPFRSSVGTRLRPTKRA